MESPGPTLNLANGLLASTPLLVLLVTLMGLKWSAPKAGAVSWLIYSRLMKKAPAA